MLKKIICLLSLSLILCNIPIIQCINAENSQKNNIDYKSENIEYSFYSE